MSLRRRLSSLERCWRAGGCGPGCPPVHCEMGGDWYGTPCTPEPAAGCPRCGRPAAVTRVVDDPDFYGTAGRLRELTT